jgi:hypothetical protein
MEQTQNIRPRYAIRPADLQDWHVVTATCLLCRHRGTVALATLSRGRPGYTRLIDLERKLGCTACGNRHGNTLEVSRKPRN